MSETFPTKINDQNGPPSPRAYWRTAVDSIAPVGPLLVFSLGWCFLFLPAYVTFAMGAWVRDENAHAPFIMAIAAGAAYVAGEKINMRHMPGLATKTAGGFVFIVGLALLFFGSVTEAEMAVSASQIFVAGGAALLFFGVDGVRRLAFPLFLMGYLIIWPGWFLDELTFPLKMLVSGVVSTMLYEFGLPVAHAGAVISAGPYQLLVAQACAGLNSLIALTSVGAVYLHIARRQSVWTNGLVLAALIPIAIIANILRVTILVLITYYFGHDAGQSFLHDGAGLLMFAVALGIVFLIDAIAAHFFEPSDVVAPDGGAAQSRSAP